MVADKSHNLQVSQQTGDSGIAGVPAQVQRQENELVSKLQDRQEEIPSHVCRASLVLFGPSSDRVRPTHIKKDNLLYSVS